MKESKVESIGLVPNEWKKCRLKDIYRFEKGKNAQQYTAEYIGENEGDYPVYSGQTENDGIMGKISTYDYDINECIFTTTVGAKCMTLRELKGKFSLSQNCLIMNKRKENINKYVLYALLPLFENEKNKIPSYMQPSLRIEDLQKFNLYLPNIKEQKIIAIFLEEEIEKIDNILKNLNNQIILLNDYKKALITETVTIGLNPNVEMKCSGIDWIGNIPKHWSVNRISNICKLKGRIGWQGLTTDEYIEEGPYLITGVDFSNGSIDWDNCEHVSEWRYNQAPEIQIKEDDLLITKDGTVGKLAIVQNCPEKATLNSGVLLIRDKNNKYINKFLYYILYSNEFWHWFEITNLGATTITHLYQNIFAKFLVALPDIKEQQEIVDYLDKKCKVVDSLMQDKKEQLEKMEQYKKSLIYEYVTGKKRVKGAEELYG